MYSVYVLETFSACEIFFQGKLTKAHKQSYRKDPSMCRDKACSLVIGMEWTIVFNSGLVGGQMKSIKCTPTNNEHITQENMWKDDCKSNIT